MLKQRHGPWHLAIAYALLAAGLVLVSLAPEVSRMIAPKVAWAARHPLRWLEWHNYHRWLASSGLDLGIEDNEKTGIPAEAGHMHMSSGGPDLRAAISHFGLRKYSSVFDIGCGKGGSLIEFHRAGFVRLCGIELSERLYRICIANLRALHITAEIAQGDAAEFSDFGSYELIYIYNPLPAEPLARVLASVARYRKPVLCCNLRHDLELVYQRTGFKCVGTLQRFDRYALLSSCDEG